MNKKIKLDNDNSKEYSNDVDPITLEAIEDIDSKNLYMLKSKNNVIYAFKLDTLVKWIEKTPKNPFTNEIIEQDELDKITTAYAAWVDSNRIAMELMFKKQEEYIQKRLKNLTIEFNKWVKSHVKHHLPIYHPARNSLVINNMEKKVLFDFRFDYSNYRLPNSLQVEMTPLADIGQIRRFFVELMNIIPLNLRFKAIGGPYHNKWLRNWDKLLEFAFRIEDKNQCAVRRGGIPVFNPTGYESLGLQSIDVYLEKDPQIYYWYIENQPGPYLDEYKNRINLISDDE